MTSTEHIWTSFHKELLAFISHSLKDRSASEDVLQDVFLKIHTRQHTLRDESRLVSWVWQITRNTVLDHFRTQKLYTEIDDSLPDTDEDPAFNWRLAQCMLPFIQNLPKQHREAILKVDIEGMSQKEFAERQGISYTAAKSRVQRARVHLKGLFLECCHLPADAYGNILDVIPRKKCDCDQRPQPGRAVSSV